MPWVAAARLHESTKAGPLAECAPLRILLLSACTIAPWAVFLMFLPILTPKQAWCAVDNACYRRVMVRS